MLIDLLFGTAVLTFPAKRCAEILNAAARLDIHFRPPVTDKDITVLKIPLRSASPLLCSVCCADEIMCLSDDYYRGCFQKRNEYMIDRSDIVITWFDGKKGGTANTLKYAEKNQKRVVNLFEEGSHEYYARYNFIAEK